MTTIKITQLTDIGANLASTTVLPVVNMSGTPTTEKTVLGNIANVVLAGAGGNYVAAAKATTATTANTVLTAAQPNITSTGNLTGLTVSNATGVVNFSNTANVTLGEVANLHISGGTNGQVLTTNGSNVLSWTTVSSGNSSYGNSNVAAYLPTYTGNIGVDTLVFADNTFQATAFVGTATTAEGLSNVGNATVVVDPLGVNNVWTFGTDGNLNTPGDIVGPANANITIYANAGVHEFIFGDDGTFYAPDNVVLGGNSIYIGPGANTLNGIEHEVFIASSNLFPYVQAVVNNISDNGSADWVALGARGGDTGGQASLGFTSSGFGDANYTITGNGDGYVLVQSYAPGQTLLGGGGNLVLATGNQGSVKDIIFGTGGFLTANTFGRISHSNNSLELTRTGASLTFPDGSIQTTAYTSSNPFDQELNTTDNVTFANVTSTEAVKFSNSGNIVGALGYASNYVSIEAYGSNAVNITANDIYTWSFDNTGHFNTPANAGSFSTGRIQSANGYPSLLAYGSNGHGGPEFNWMNGDDLNDMSNVNVLRNTVYLNAEGFYIGINENGVANTFTGSWTFGNTGLFTFPGTPRIDTSNDNFEVQAAESINFEANTVVNIYTDTSNNAFQWQFGDDGNLTLPGNTFAVNYANGTPVSISGGNTGNVTFDNVTVQGVNGLNLSAGSDFTANLAYLQVRAGDVASHIHLDTGNNQAYDLILGDDQNYVQVSSTGNILLSAYDSNTNQYTWTLDYNGNLILAGGNSVIQSIANSSLDILNPNVSTMVLTPDPGYSSQALVLDPTSVGHIHLRSPSASSNIDNPSANLFLGGEASSFEVGIGYGSAPNVYVHSNNNTWTFDTTGNLTIPGTSGGFIKTASNASIGIVAIDNGTNNPAQLLSINAGSGAATSIVSAYATNATIQTNASGNINTWSFDNAGNLTLPTGGQIIVSGGLVSSGASPAPTINGFSITNSVGISGTGNIAGNNISATGNVTAQGVGTNMVRRANTISGSNTTVTLDNLTALVGGTPKRLYIGAATSNMTMAGQSQTMSTGALAVSSWINVPIVTGTGNGFAMSGAITNDGDTAVLNVTDQGAGSGTWRVTGMIANTSANLYSVSIERLA